MDKKETSFESVLHIYLNISREKAFGRIIDSGQVETFRSIRFCIIRLARDEGLQRSSDRNVSLYPCPVHASFLPSVPSLPPFFLIDANARFDARFSIASILNGVSLYRELWNFRRE